MSVHFFKQMKDAVIKFSGNGRRHSGVSRLSQKNIQLIVDKLLKVNRMQNPKNAWVMSKYPKQTAIHNLYKSRQL
jgi:hypothetical protein